eukprot:scaffold106399_cov63-Phaeocystis_antarctica.AAC.2
MTSITDAFTIRKTTPTAQNGRLCSGRCSSTLVECLSSIRPTALQQQPTNTRIMPMIQSSIVNSALSYTRSPRRLPLRCFGGSSRGYNERKLPRLLGI